MRLLRVSYLTALCHGAFAWKPASDWEPDTEPPRLRTTATSPTSREYTHAVAAMATAMATPGNRTVTERPCRILAVWTVRTTVAIRTMSAMTS